MNAKDLSNSTTSAVPPPPTSGTSADTTHKGSRNLAATIGAVVGASVMLLVLASTVLLVRRHNRRIRNEDAYHVDLLSERDFYRSGRKDGSESVSSFASSSESLAPKRHTIPPNHYSYSNESRLSASSRFREALRDDHEGNLAAAPLMNFDPLAGSCMSPVSERPASQIVSHDTETRLEGPDNSLARYARRSAAEREEELTRGVKEL